MLKRLMTDRAVKTSLALCAGALWVLVLLQIWHTTRTPRYQLFKVGENNPNVFLLDTRTGYVWTTFATENSSAGKFGDVTPGDTFHPIP